MTTTTTLKSFLGRGQHLGTAVMPEPLIQDKSYGELICSEFDTVCVEHHLKWQPLLLQGRGEHVYDFTMADLVVDWAQSKGLQVKGHTLVWHVTSPDIILKDKSPQQLREAIRRHIFTTCGHFNGRVKSWDVVNEALAPDGSFAETLFTSRIPAMELIEDAFKWARAADPNAELIYNDNKVECVHAEKSMKMFSMLESLKRAHVPIDGVGLQAHFDAAGTGLKRPATPGSLRDQIRRLATLGLRVNVSEMDVRIAKLDNLDEATRVQAQCDIYYKATAACYREPAFEGMTFWGFTDKHTWCDQFYWKDTPLLFDRDYNKKPAYFAIQDALKSVRDNAEKVKDDNEWTGSWVPQSPIASSQSEKRAKVGEALPDWQLEAQ